MKLFDLHCDTAGECKNRSVPLFNNDLQLNICKGKILNKWCQLFAIWIPDNLRGKEAENYFDAAYDNFAKEIAENPCEISLCKTYSDMIDAEKSGRCAAIITMEGASAAVGKGRLDELKSKGVKLITLTWNGKNEIGCGAVTGEEDGLTAFGKEFLTELESRNIVADVSHLNRKGFYEVMRRENLPVIASHSNSAEVLRRTRVKSLDGEMSIRRSLDDEQIKLLIERGSLIGINYCKSFLGDKGDDGFAAIERHMRHILDLGGENILAAGSDYDGCDINDELSSIDKVPALRAYLAQKGFCEELLEKIFYSNAHSFFESILQRG